MKPTLDPNERYVSLMAKDQYMREMRTVVRLTGEEEAVLVERLHRGKVEQVNAIPHQWVLMLAKDARERLAVNYQWMVISIATRYARNREGLEFLDLIQEGNLGLMRAIDGDAENVKQLCAMVKICVRGEVVNALHRDRMKLRVSRDVSDTFYAMFSAKRRLRAALGRVPTFQEVAEHMGVSEQKLERVVREMHQAEQVESIQALSTWDDDGDHEDKLDFVGMYQSVYAHETERLQELEQSVQDALEQELSGRQREVMAMRYGVGGGVGGGCTQMEVARVFGITDRGVGAIERTAKERLRKALSPLVETSDEAMSA